MRFIAEMSASGRNTIARTYWYIRYSEFLLFILFVSSANTIMIMMEKMIDVCMMLFFLYDFLLLFYMILFILSVFKSH